MICHQHLPWLTFPASLPHSDPAVLRWLPVHLEQDPTLVEVVQVGVKCGKCGCYPETAIERGNSLPLAIRKPLKPPSLLPPASLLLPPAV